MGCRGFLQCAAKLTNFLLAMVGVGMIAYSIWMMNEWSRQGTNNPPQPSEPAVVPPDFRSGFPSWIVNETKKVDGSSETTKAEKDAHDNDVEETARVQFRTQKEGSLSGNSVGGDMLKDDGIKFPAPWFIYVFLIAGVFTCMVTCTGLIGAETNSGCCLSCYSLGLAVLLMAQATLAAVIFLDETWEQDFPVDPTGEEAKAKAFVLTHRQICQWTAVAVLTVEIVGLLLSLTLKAMQEGNNRHGYDSDEEFRVTARSASIRQPLLPRVQQNGMVASQIGPAGGQAPPRNDAWTTRMREKYGLDVADFSYNPEAGRRYQQAPARVSDENESRGGCTIM